jgi:hypothetical protein
MEKKSMSSQEDEEGPGVRSQEDEDRYDRTGPLGSRLGPTNRLGAFNLSRGPLESINLSRAGMRNRGASDSSEHSRLQMDANEGSSTETVNA